MKALFTPYIYTLFFTLFLTSIHAQNWQLKIIPSDSISKLALKSVSFKETFNSTDEILVELDSILYQLEQIGIFTPQLELLNATEQVYIYKFSAGKIFDEIALNFEKNQFNTFLKDYNYNEKSNTINIPVSQTKPFLKTLIAHFESIGYPFVDVQLKNQKIESDQLSAFVNITVANKRTIDKIVIEGYSAFPLSFINHQTPLKIGTTFNQQKINKTAESLHRLSFVHQLKEPAILFTKDSTIIYLYLDKKKAHQFDGLIGFNNTENSSKLKLHGYVDVQLNNLFNKGEQLAIHWQNTTQKQTSFQLKTSIPFILNSPISLEGSFNLYKQDAAFLTTSFYAGLMYPFEKHLIKVSLHSYSSNVLTNANNILMDDFTKLLYGLTYSYKLETENRFFPTELEGELSAFTGTRKTFLGNTTQQEVQLLINYTWKINRRNYIFAQNQSAKLIGNQFLINELFLIGGTNSIRGFNENQLFSTAYSIFKLEYRMVTSIDSYFYTITDYGISKNKVDTTNFNMLGLGLGYVFKVNSGFLNFSYSIGKFSNTSFDINQSKVHLKWLQKF